MFLLFRDNENDFFLICTDGPAMDARKPEHLGVDSGFRFFYQDGNRKEVAKGLNVFSMQCLRK